MSLNRVSDTLVVIAAAGSGSRFGGEIPKALFELSGQTLLARSVATAAATQGVVGIVVVAPPAHTDQVMSLCRLLPATALDRVLVVPGGATRGASVGLGLAAAQHAGMTYSIVLVHDAARALAPMALFERVADAVRSGHPAVIPALPIADTVRRVDSFGTVVETVDRTMLRTVQTPQGFRSDVLHAAHAGDGGGEGQDRTESAVTDDAGLVERLGYKPHIVDGDLSAMKITRRHDVLLAESLLRASGVGVGVGTTMR